MSTAISGMGAVPQPKNLESTTIVSEETKQNDFAEISKIVSEGGTLSNTEFQRLLSDMEKLAKESDLSADEQDLLNRFMNLAKQVNEAANNGQNPANIYITANGDNTIDEWGVFVTQKKQESTLQRREFLTGNAMIDSFSSVQILTLYGNVLVVNMSNETASTLTVMQKLFEKVTDALSQLQSFLSKMNAFYKSALTATQEKGKKMEKKDPVGAAPYSGAIAVDWTQDGLSGYMQKNGNYYPPLENYPGVPSVDGNRDAIFFDAEMIPDIVREEVPGFNNQHYLDDPDDPGIMDNPGSSWISYRINDGEWGTRVSYAITPEVMDKVLQKVSMLLAMVLPKTDASQYGSFYDVNKGNLTNSLTLDTLISDISNKMKLVSDLATKMNEQMRQLQNTIDSSKQQYNSAQSMFMQQQNKM